MKTLLELIFALPTWERAGAPAAATGAFGASLTEVLLAAEGAGVGAFDLQTDGCPAQAYPDWILHDTHPGDETLPVSHDSVPAMIPSPQTGAQMP